ncbi:hypothetical protein Ppb6_02806 [Photorhabdus australis subsp. thailandensis]|uniref:Uncharacterized protein n=1 Tax=Photorhabdus australis subsp. thailandensis TaxID=2805096 RepID=A0A1C0U255_9GAMM|nr:hypothetical protein [Photorhabdus australis]OCQ52012.1 hypothetical protein Ppb6_02806 [Photorhabdus australis subsp. thailandensis]
MSNLINLTLTIIILMSISNVTNATELGNALFEGVVVSIRNVQRNNDSKNVNYNYISFDIKPNKSLNNIKKDDFVTFGLYSTVDNPNSKASLQLLMTSFLTGATVKGYSDQANCKKESVKEEGCYEIEQIRLSL